MSTEAGAALGQERYARITEALVDGHIVLDHGGRILEVNGLYCTLSGYSRGELLAMCMADLDGTLDAVTLAARSGSAAVEGAGRFTSIHRRRDGALLHFEASVFHLPDDGGRFHCFLRDITDQQRSRAIMAARLRLMELAPHSTLDVILRRTLDEVEAITGSCIGFYHFLGEDQRTLTLQAWSTLTATRFCSAEGAGSHYDIDRAGVWVDCVRLRKPVIHNDYASLPSKRGLPPGHAAVVRELVVPVFRNNRIVAILGIGNKQSDYTGQDVETVTTLADLAWDVAERKNNEMMLLEALKAAEAASRAKSEFLANVSHEIRTPMNGVIGNIQLLRFTDLAPDQQRCLKNIETDANSLVSLINDVLDLSRIEAGKIEIEQATFSLRDCIDEVLKPQTPRIHAKGLEIRTRVSAGIPDLLFGDQLRLRQILMNLVANAVKFTERGEISVRVDMVGLNGDLASIRFSVADTGIGIKAEARERILDPFTQADSSTTRKFGGSGLGLAICNRLTALMGGELSLESEEGRGSVFRVTLPFRVEPSRDTTSPSPRSNAFIHEWEGEALRILLADDNRSNREMTAALLKHFRHTVTTVDNGAEAVQAWLGGDYDVILMDVQMPVMDGLEAAGKIRHHEREIGGHMPIIAMTAHALEDDRLHLLGSGFDGYISKPLQLALLNAEMMRVVRPEAGAVPEEICDPI